MSSPGMGNGTGFDPFNQPVTLLAPDGLTKVTFPLSQVMELQQSVVCQAISSAIQTGAALILLLTLILITNREKRRSLVYLLNAFALLIIFVRGILTFFAYTGPFFNFYRWELQYYTNLRSGQDLSVAGEIMGFLLIAAIEFSLALQVRIVCCDLPTAQRLTVNAINALVAFIVAGVRFALMVLNILWNIVGVEYETEAQYHILGRLESATNITFVVSVGISTVLFCTKLAFAIASRRSLGMTQFGPMQIIFIMGCQTMCTPLIFTIITYWGVPKNALPQLSGVPDTVVALSLPLSALWATANTAHRSAVRPRNNVHCQIPAGRDDYSKAKSYQYTDTTASGTLVGDLDTSLPSSPNKKGAFNASEMDLEMQQIVHGGVQVDRSYSVRSD